MDAEQAIRELEDRLDEANLTVDVPTLESIMSDDFLYTSGVGAGLSRDQWLETYPLKRSTPEQEKRAEATRKRAAAQGRGTVLLVTGLRVGEENQYEIEIHGPVAIANKRYSIQDPDGSERCLRYVRVYRQEAEGWRLVSHRHVHSVD
jgi:hypothetical protein